MSHLRRFAIAGLSVTALVAFATPASAAPKITDLGVPNGSSVSQSTDINADGVVVGSNENHAVRWTDTITVLPSLGGPASAYAVNAHGTTVGWSNNAENLPYAVKWDSAGELTVLEGGDSAEGINDSGVAVGSRHTDRNQAVRWDANGQISVLTPLSRFDDYAAKDINNNGVIVGYANERSGNDLTRYAVRWDADGVITKLGRPNGFKHCVAQAVNAAGAAAGSCTNYPANNETHAVRWDPAGNVADLGVLCGVWSEAVDINDSGAIVGTAKDTRDTTHAVSWNEHNACRDLGNLPGGTWAVAAGINNNGAVVGYAKHSTDPYHAVRWDG